LFEVQCTTGNYASQNRRGQGIKDNQPQLLTDLRICFQEDPVVGEVRGVAREVSRGHGQLEVREIVTSPALKGYLDWPGLEQVLRIRRTVTTLKTRETPLCYGRAGR
jgi:hypothetical protein